MEIFKKYLEKVKVRVQEQPGIGLIEAIVAVAITGVTVVALVAALSAGSVAVREDDRESVSQRLARTQLEYVKSCSYNPTTTTYPAVATPEGYTVDVAVNPVHDTNADIQKITVTVAKDGGETLIVENYKVNR